MLLSDVGSLLLSKNLFLTGYFEAELIFNFVENEMNVDSGSKDSGDISFYLTEDIDKNWSTSTS